VLRLAAAVRSGARVATEHWAHCSRVVSHSGDASLQAIYRAAAQGHACPITHAERRQP